MFKDVQVKTKFQIELFQLKDVQECLSKNKNLESICFNSRMFKRVQLKTKISDESVSTQGCSREFKLKQKYQTNLFPVFIKKSQMNLFPVFIKIPDESVSSVCENMF
jgi:hypothetical protein